jgi:hypothetical protein
VILTAITAKSPAQDHAQVGPHTRRRGDVTRDQI